MSKLKRIAKGIAVGLIITAIALPLLGMLVDTDLSLFAKTLMLLLVPSIVITNNNFFHGTDDAILNLILIVTQTCYWAGISALWFWWKDRNNKE